MGLPAARYLHVDAESRADRLRELLRAAPRTLVPYVNGRDVGSHLWQATESLAE